MTALILATALATQLATPQMTCGSDSMAESVYDYYYNEIVRKDLAADAAWAALKTPAEIAAHQRTLRARWVDAVGGFPDRTPLHVKVTGVLPRDGYRIEKILFESRPKHYVTAHLFLPDDPKFKAPYPGIVSPCGHSNSGKCAPWYQRPGVIAAKRGFAYLVYDPIDQGERLQIATTNRSWSTTGEHNRLGMRAALIGWGAAQFRVWDGMRAIDVLASRKDVKGPKYAVMGISGGGTLTSYIMAFDSRVGAACPAGYLTNMRNLCCICGPQDAEQNVHGQLAYGFNHLGYILLRAPSPVLVNATHADFFPFGGTLETFAAAQKVYATLGAADRLGLFDVPGPHHWYESEQVASTAWARQWICGEVGAYPSDLAPIKQLDVGFSYAAIDCATADVKNPYKPVTPEGSVTPTGFVMDLPGARSTYDIVRDEFVRVKAERPTLTPMLVRQVAGIRPAKELKATAVDVCEIKEKDVRIRRMTLVTPENLRIPTVSFYPAETKGAPVILVSDAARATLEGSVSELLAAGRAVMVAELRGFGESGVLRGARQRGGFYGCHDEDEEISMMCSWLGISFVGARAEDLIVAAKAFAETTGGAAAEIIAEGRACIPAAHARCAEPELFSQLKTVRAPASWSAVLNDPLQTYRFANIVYGALKYYDWTDL